MPQTMPPKDRIKDVPTGGFILFEVLMAMALVMTSWMAIGNSYQFLALRWGQLQEKRALIYREADQFERSVFNPSTQKTGVIHESTRVLSRAGSQPHLNRSVNSNQR